MEGVDNRGAADGRAAPEIVISIDGGAAVNWSEFVSANTEDLGPDALATIRADLDQYGLHHGGGGAAGEFSIQTVASGQVGRAPDCATPRAAAIAGIIANAVMAHEMDLEQDDTPEVVYARFPGLKPGHEFVADVSEGFRVAGLMISARARASVRTPSHAAISAAEAALALAEDALDAATLGMIIDAAGEGFLASIRDTLRAGLSPLHAAEGSGPVAA